MSSYQDIRQILAEKKEYVTLISGVSMLPIIRYKKDPVLLHPVSGGFHRYDVVLYSKAELFVLHRIIEVHSDYCIIRGDNCLAKETVPNSDIVGRMAGLWRGGKFISTDSLSFRLYSRIWVALNPLLHIHRYLQGRLSSLKRHLCRCR